MGERVRKSPNAEKAVGVELEVHVGAHAHGQALALQVSPYSAEMLCFCMGSVYGGDVGCLA